MIIISIQLAIYINNKSSIDKKEREKRKYRKDNKIVKPNDKKKEERKNEIKKER